MNELTVKNVKVGGMELIPIINDGDIRAVDGRTLHTFLEVGTKFFDWISRRVEKYGFVENEDFQRVTQKRDTLGGEQETVDYIISLDMAKELAMVENNEKGKQARRYFIEIEKQFKQNSPVKVPTTFREALLLAAEQQLVIEQQEAELKTKQAEIEYKSEVIAGITENVDIATMRTIINRVVKMSNSSDSIQKRYNNIYKIFREVKHVDLKARMEGANIREGKTKFKSVIDYAEKNGFLRDLYDICAKYYETDVKTVIDEIVEGSKRK